MLQGSFSNLAMNGQEVFKFAVRAVPTVSATSFYVGVQTGGHCSSMPRLACMVLQTAAACLPGPQKYWSVLPLPTARSPANPAPLATPPQVIEAALENANMQREQIDWLVMHQVRMWACWLGGGNAALRMRAGVLLQSRACLHG